MRIYLASRYGRREELVGYRRDLEAAGHECVSSWLDGTERRLDSGKMLGADGVTLVESSDNSNAAAELRARCARADLLELVQADAIVVFAEHKPCGVISGGHHVEFGIALGINYAGAMVCNTSTLRLLVVGRRGNLFHWTKGVEFYPDWPAALVALGPAGDDDLPEACGPDYRLCREVQAAGEAAGDA